MLDAALLVARARQNLDSLYAGDAAVDGPRLIVHTNEQSSPSAEQGGLYFLVGQVFAGDRQIVGVGL
ncbi:MAG: hypothetical protein U0271_35660 [Polyangiaceae bacterium]